MLLGGWAELPTPLGGGKSEAQRLYEAMRDGRGDSYSKDDAALANRELRAHALGYARAASYQRRGAWQAHPGLATDLLPEWELRLTGRTLAGETIAARQAVLDGVLCGNGFASYDNIVAALRLAIGETAVLIAARAKTRFAGTPGSYGNDPDLVFNEGGGDFKDGEHHLRIAAETADGMFYPSTRDRPFTPPIIDTPYSIIVQPQPLSAWPAGTVRLHYYVSVSPTLPDSLAWVASGGGGPIEISRYPRSIGEPGLHHLGVVVSSASWASASQRAKIHTILGPMLPGHVTYDIVTGSPFLLNTAAPPGSPLGMGAF